MSTLLRNGIRTLCVRISAPSQANLVVVTVNETLPIVGAAINGSRLPHNKHAAGEPSPWALHSWNAPRDGIELALDVQAAQPLRLTVTAGTPGLPAIPGMPYQDRPPHMLAHDPFEDRTLVSPALTFEARR